MMTNRKQVWLVSSDNRFIFKEMAAENPQLSNLSNTRYRPMHWKDDYGLGRYLLGGTTLQRTIATLAAVNVNKWTK